MDTDCRVPIKKCSLFLLRARACLLFWWMQLPWLLCLLCLLLLHHFSTGAYVAPTSEVHASVTLLLQTAGMYSSLQWRNVYNN
jgi:hypothetical protein